MQQLTRGQLLRRGAAAAGGLALLDPASVFARTSGSPNPIPGGFDPNFNPVPSDPFIHVLPPGAGFEMSTITDFKGVVGAADTQGSAHGSDGTPYDFDTDMRFMSGTYVDTSGRVRTGTFGFI
jgi:hypothetical protein